MTCDLEPIGPAILAAYAELCRKRATWYEQNAGIAERKGDEAKAASHRMRAADFQAEARRCDEQASAGQ